MSDLEGPVGADIALALETCEVAVKLEYFLAEKGVWNASSRCVAQPPDHSYSKSIPIPFFAELPPGKKHPK